MPRIDAELYQTGSWHLGNLKKFNTKVSRTKAAGKPHQRVAARLNPSSIHQPDCEQNLMKRDIRHLCACTV